VLWKTTLCAARSLATPWQDQTTQDSAGTHRAGPFPIPLDQNRFILRISTHDFERIT